MAAAIAVFSVLAGAIVGLFRRGRLARPIHTFALVAALVVVLAELLPSAIAALGWSALAIAALAFVAPALVERLGPKSSGLEVAYVGLLVHKVVDGVALEAFLGGAHAGHGHGDIALALALHAIPITALVVVTYLDRGLMHVGARVLGLVGATLLGTALAGSAGGLLERFDPYVMAVVAGLLLHVVAMTVNSDRPSSTFDRAADLLAVVAGVALTVFGGHSHHAETQTVRDGIGEAFLTLALATAPVLLIGLTVAAILEIAVKDSARASSRKALGQALTGVFVGFRRPICACGILPKAHTLSRRNAPPAMVVAFLFATPALGIETFALTARFFDWPMALLRLGAGLLVATAAGLVVGRIAGRDGDLSARPDERSATRWVDDFDELLLHKGPWILLGLVIASYAYTLPAETFATVAGVDVLIVALVAAPSYFCAASATPLAAVLLMKGLSPEAVLAGLVIGPVMNLAILGWIRETYGLRATVLALLAFFASLGGITAFIHMSPWNPTVVLDEAGPLAIASAVILGLAVLRGIWLHGLVPWLGSLRETFGFTPEHGHGHGHGH